MRESVCQIALPPGTVSRVTQRPAPPCWNHPSPVTVGTEFAALCRALALIVCVTDTCTIVLGAGFGSAISADRSTCWAQADSLEPPPAEMIATPAAAAPAIAQPAAAPTSIRR